MAAIFGDRQTGSCRRQQDRPEVLRRHLAVSYDSQPAVCGPMAPTTIAHTAIAPRIVQTACNQNGSKTADLAAPFM
ncbi:hypothetical protein ACOMHN_002821 [Nucella lapillus]